MMRRHSWLPTLFEEIEDIRHFMNEFDVPTWSKEEGSGLSIYEDDNHIYVEAAVPGLKSEDIQVTLEKGLLWIKGESKEEKKDVKYHLKSSQSFSYRVPIPYRIDETITPEAVCKDGILRITFTKSKIEKPQKIQVKIK